MLGGNRIPSVPPAASEPADSRGLYLRCCSSGSATRPIEAAVTTLEPLIAAKIAQPAILVCNSPPGIHATKVDRPR
jgi:hypothetical protein